MTPPIAVVDAYRWFRSNGSACSHIERACVALALARAEYTLNSREDLRVTWDWDHNADVSWLTEAELEAGSEGQLFCRVFTLEEMDEDGEWQPIDSCGGIWSTPMTDWADERIWEATMMDLNMARVAPATQLRLV